MIVLLYIILCESSGKIKMPLIVSPRFNNAVLMQITRCRCGVSDVVIHKNNNVGPVGDAALWR